MKRKGFDRTVIASEHRRATQWNSLAGRVLVDTFVLHTLVSVCQNYVSGMLPFVGTITVVLFSFFSYNSFYIKGFQVRLQCRLHVSFIVKKGDWLPFGDK